MAIVDKRYAQALADTGYAINNMEKVKEQLSDVIRVFEEVDDFRNLMLNPQFKTDIKKNTVLKIFHDSISSIVLQFIMVLIEKRRIDRIKEIYEEFKAIADLRSKLLNIKVFSPYELDDDQMRQLRAKYMKILSVSMVHIDVELDPSLIGGIKVIIGDEVIDNTVKSKLRDMQEALI